MNERYEKFGWEIQQMSVLLTAIKNIQFVFHERARELAKMELTPAEKKWIKSTQGKHAKPILDAIKENKVDVKPDSPT